MSSIRQALLFSVVASGRLVGGQAIDQLPVVNIRLGPPVHALPQVSAEISVLEGARKGLETTFLQELDLAFANAMKHASTTVPHVVASALGSGQKFKMQRAVSFLEVDTAAQSFAIEVHPPHAPDIAIKGKLDQIEQKRSTDETHIFEQAVREFAALESIFTSEVLTQLNAQANGSGLHKALGFLQTSKGMRRSGSGDLPSGFNVRLSASSQSFPTVEGLALAMEDRRDASEETVRNRVLELESEFFKAANDLLVEALRARFSGTA